MSADCVGGKMLVALAEPEQTKLACPVCGATGLMRASVVNGHGVIPHHEPVPHRSLGIVAAPAATLAPSEVTLAKVLAAYQKGDWLAVGDALYAACLIGNGKDEGGLSPIGQALLERARKEGVL